MASYPLILLRMLNHDGTRRVMQILTDQPGIQRSAPPLKGKIGAGYDGFHGLCLETQHHPDSIHHAEFLTTILCPGETCRSVTVHQFSKQ